MPEPSKLINCTNIVSCFQNLYNFFFTLLVALAFLSFLYGAFQYLLSGGGVFQKEAGKKKMINSVIAIIVALTIPIILNMINPNIFKAELNIPFVQARLPEYISASETPPEDILKPGETPVDAPPNKNLEKSLAYIKYIKELIVDCSSLKMQIIGVNYADQEVKVADGIPINTGKRVNGQNCIEANIAGSHTTPKGTFLISEKRYNPNGLISRESPHSSMGTRALVYDGSRGLLIHGSGTEARNRALPPTWGCIRMKNEDLAAIYDKVQVGKTVLIIK